MSWLLESPISLLFGDRGVRCHVGVCLFLLCFLVVCRFSRAGAMADCGSVFIILKSLLTPHWPGDASGSQAAARVPWSRASSGPVSRCSPAMDSQCLGIPRHPPRACFFHRTFSHLFPTTSASLRHLPLLNSQGTSIAFFSSALPSGHLVTAEHEQPVLIGSWPWRDSPHLLWDFRHNHPLPRRRC